MTIKEWDKRGIFRERLAVSPVRPPAPRSGRDYGFRTTCEDSEVVVRIPWRRRCPEGEGPVLGVMVVEE
jgi:hypothetical protein